MTDPIVESVCAKLRARSEVGIKKYGVTLADSPEDMRSFLIHAQEEAMDLVNYIETLLTKMGEDVSCVELSNMGDMGDMPDTISDYTDLLKQARVAMDGARFHKTNEHVFAELNKTILAINKALEETK